MSATLNRHICAREGLLRTDSGAALRLTPIQIQAAGGGVEHEHSHWSCSFQMHDGSYCDGSGLQQMPAPHVFQMCMQAVALARHRLAGHRLILSIIV